MAGVMMQRGCSASLIELHPRAGPWPGAADSPGGNQETWARQPGGVIRLAYSSGKSTAGNQAGGASIVHKER